MGEEIISVLDYILSNPIVIASLAISAIIGLVVFAVALVIIIKVIKKFK